MKFYIMYLEAFTSLITKQSKLDLVINLFKILIIVSVSIILIGDFTPYFAGVDTYMYAIAGIQFADSGSYDLTNELLQTTGKWEFVPSQFVKTVHNTAVPMSQFGLPYLVALSYAIGGVYPLFYIGPAFTILLIIASERISTSFFGKYVGLLTLIFLSTNYTIISIGKVLLIDNIIALLVILGIFFLEKFFKNNREIFIILSSFFFIIAFFIRLNAVFPNMTSLSN